MGSGEILESLVVVEDVEGIGESASLSVWSLFCLRKGEEEERTAVAMGDGRKGGKVRQERERMRAPTGKGGNPGSFPKREVPMNMTQNIPGFHISRSRLSRGLRREAARAHTSRFHAYTYARFIAFISLFIIQNTYVQQPSSLVSLSL